MKTKTIQANSSMENKVENIIFGTGGIFVGFIDFIQSYLLDMGYWSALAKAGLTALVCGGAGIAGKYMIVWIWGKLKQKFKKR